VLLDALCPFRAGPAPRARVLLPKQYFFDDVDTQVEELVRRAAGLLGTPETVDLGDVKAVWNANTVILYCDAAAFHEERLKEHPDWFGTSLMTGFPWG
jgi:hypothetical protein